MSKLTLPIQVGKTYLRRDGKKVTCNKVDEGNQRYGQIAYFDGGDCCWVNNGRVDMDRWNHPLDIVSDYVEPEWISDPHDIEGGMMRNPKYILNKENK